MIRILLLLVIFWGNCGWGVERYIEGDGVSLFVRDEGEGDPILILHGGPGLDQGYLYEEMRVLGKNHRVIFFDQRGCGRSSGEVNLSTITMENFVADIERIRVALGIEKMTLLGHSWGGLLGMHYAIRHEDRLNKLILMNSIGATSGDMREFLGEVMRRMGDDMEFINYLVESEAYIGMDPEVEAIYYRTWFRHYLYDQEKLDDLRLEFSAESVRGSRGVRKIFSETFFQKPYDLLPKLEGLEIPVLIIHGESDPIPLGGVEEMYRAIVNAKLYVMKECGHFPFVEKPEELFELLNRRD